MPARRKTTKRKIVRVGLERGLESIIDTFAADVQVSLYIAGIF